MLFPHICVFLNKPAYKALAEEVCSFLRAQKRRVTFISSLKNFKKYDLLISLGGDGTILRCARETAPKKIPVFGINCGTLGFLASAEKENIYKSLTDLLAGKCVMQERFMLVARVTCPHHKPRTAIALNDAVLRAGAPRAFLTSARWNKALMPAYFGDGVIVSTPTGSSAYSLSAGGPIVEPSVDVLVITPICSHSLLQRPVVLPANGKLILEPSFKNKKDTALLSLDGQTNLPICAGSQIEISRAQFPALFLLPPERDFFTLLHRKLNWGNL